MTRLRDRHLALGLAFIGVLTSMVASWVPSVWKDEAVSIQFAQREWGLFWVALQQVDAVHAVYYVILRVWLIVVPDTPFWIRLLSGLATGVATGLVYLLARRWLGRGPACVAAALFLLLPRTIWMAIEARSSALSTVAAVAATGLLAWWVQQTRRWVLVAYAIVLGLGIALHVYLALLVLTHALTLALRASRSEQVWRRWLPAAVAAFVVAAPVFLLAAGQTGQVTRARHGVAAWARQVGLSQFFLGDFAADGVAPGWLRLRLITGVGLTFLTAGVVIFALVRSHRGWRNSPVVVWCLPWLVLPTLVVMGHTLVGGNLYHPRYFAFCSPALAILLAWGVSQLSAPTLRVGVVVTLCLLGATTGAFLRTPHAKDGFDWKQAAQVVEQSTQPGDGVWFGSLGGPRRIAAMYPKQLTGRLLLNPYHLDRQDLAAALDRSHPARVCGVWHHDDRYRPRHDRILLAHHYHPTSTWTGPRTTISCWESG